MDAIVVYESVYGNTREIAEAIADGVGAVAVLPVHEAQRRHGTADLLIVGGPTHMHGLATKRSRHVAATTAQEDGRSHLEAGATIEPGLRSWLHDLSPGAAHHAAAFDTRLDKSPRITGAAARGIARRLRRLGIDVVAAESFLVEDTEGPPKAGELERARAWGAELARSLPAPQKQLVET
ncbi:MAG: flavodoxin family protein [Solirubrobacteraceae bacterium]